VVGIAAMVTLVEPTADTEQMAGCTMSPTELDICLHFDHSVIEPSAQVLYSSMTALESCQIAIQPGSDMIYTQIDQIIQTLLQFCDECGVGHELPWGARGRGLQQGDELGLNLRWWKWFSIRDSEDCHSIIALHDQVGVEVLET
jgi:hypothetical protein